MDASAGDNQAKLANPDDLPTTNPADTEKLFPRLAGVPDGFGKSTFFACLARFLSPHRTLSFP
jgi:hypothetical protein